MVYAEPTSPRFLEALDALPPRPHRRVVYTRCTGPHFFATEQCPFDGWALAERQALLDAVRTLERDTLDLAALARLGVPETHLSRVVLADFDDPRQALAAVAIDGLFDGPRRSKWFDWDW
ncbi:MAG: hypothetical protein AB7S26_04215 [Sandaracinaceae bacterium]